MPKGAAGNRPAGYLLHLRPRGFKARGAGFRPRRFLVVHGPITGQRRPSVEKGDVRIGILAIANLWSAWLLWLVTRRYSERFVRRGLAMLWFAAALAVVDSAWWLMFWGWASK